MIFQYFSRHIEFSRTFQENSIFKYFSSLFEPWFNKHKCSHKCTQSSFSFVSNISMSFWFPVNQMEQIIINPFMSNGTSYSYPLDQSISILRAVGWYFNLNFNRTFCKQTVLQCLIWVCTVLHMCHKKYAWLIYIGMNTLCRCNQCGSLSAGFIRNSSKCDKRILRKLNTQCTYLAKYGVCRPPDESA